MGVSDLTIRQLGPQGDGIHQSAQGRVYVERTIPGDRVRARVHKDSEGLVRAEVISIVEASAHRQAPPCPHYDRCGNCSLQHVTPRFYRGWKIEMVQEAFRKVGLQPRRWLDPIFVAGNSRRRATFAVQKDRGHTTVGYYQRRSKLVTEIDSCLVADPRIMALRDRLKPLLSTIVTDDHSADVFLQLVGDTADMVITGSVGRTGAPDKSVRDAITKLIKGLPIARVGWRSHERERVEPVMSRMPVVATFGTLKVALPPASFLQATAEGERALVNAVMSAIPSRGKFADLFSGCGTFTGPMLSRGPVDAYESLPASVNALVKASGDLPLKVFRRDLFRQPLRREEMNRYDAVVFDPPRAGCREQAENMASSKTPTLIGVSCNPATFARDASILCDGGYWLQSLQLVDQFLYSHHVELVGVFTKRGRSKR